MWHRRGFGYFEDFMRLKLMQGLQPSRFLIGKGEDRDVVFLDGDSDKSPFCVVEHRKMVHGAWTYPVCQNSAQYLNGSKDGLVECYACKAGSNKHFVGMLTVIDLTGFTSKDGKKHAGLRRLFCANEKCLMWLASLRSQLGGSLAGAIVRVTADESAEWGGCGTSWKFWKQVTPDKYVELAKKVGGDMSRNPWEPYVYESFVANIPNDAIQNLWDGKVNPKDPAVDEEVAY